MCDSIADVFLFVWVFFTIVDGKVPPFRPPKAFWCQVSHDMSCDSQELLQLLEKTNAAYFPLIKRNTRQLELFHCTFVLI